MTPPRNSSKPEADAWPLRPGDLPRPSSRKNGSEQLDALRQALPENFIFRWLTWRRRAGRIPRVFYFEPALIGYLWGPGLVLTSPNFIFFPDILQILFFAACAVMATVLLLRLLFMIFFRGPRRGVLMNLPHHLFDELSLTGYTTDTLFEGIWGDALRPARQRRLRIQYSLLFALLATVCWSDLGLLLATPLMAWCSGRFMISFAAYPYADLPRIHRIVRSQTVRHLRRRWFGYSGGQFMLMLTVVGPMAAGFFIWAFYFITTSYMYESMTDDFPAPESYTPIYILLTVFWVLFGGVLGVLRAMTIRNNHEQKIYEIKQLIDQIVCCEQGREPQQIPLMGEPLERTHAR